jgi:hypothetical protein
MAQTHPPAVLIVDDDRGVTEYLREMFREKTSIGVYVANDLTEAKNLIDDPDVHIGAIIADLMFEEAKSAPELDLFDGIDILHYAQQRREGLAKYVLSFWADREREHEKVEDLKLDVDAWMHKMFHANSNDPGTPWARIERDLKGGSGGDAQGKRVPAIEARTETPRRHVGGRRDRDVIIDKVIGDMATDLGIPEGELRSVTDPRASRQCNTIGLVAYLLNAYFYKKVLPNGLTYNSSLQRDFVGLLNSRLTAVRKRPESGWGEKDAPVLSRATNRLRPVSQCEFEVLRGYAESVMKLITG